MANRRAIVYCSSAVRSVRGENVTAPCNFARGSWTKKKEKKRKIKVSRTEKIKPTTRRLSSALPSSPPPPPSPPACHTSFLPFVSRQIFSAPSPSPPLLPPPANVTFRIRSNRTVPYRTNDTVPRIKIKNSSPLDWLRVKREWEREIESKRAILRCVCMCRGARGVS